MSSSRRGQAVVLGGSMAGMLAARVLSESYSRVTLVERDVLPAKPAERRSIPQSCHLHVLLRRGLDILEELFPGLQDELLAHGAIRIDSGADLKWLTPAGWGPRFVSGLEKLAFSRELLDWLVYRSLIATPNIRVRDGWEARGLLSSAPRTVTGVRLRRGAGEEDVGADLVVDATGRASRLPAWMRELGFEPPAEKVVDAFLGYASRLYERPPGPDRDWKAAFVQAAPPSSNRAGVLFPIEGDRWCCTLAGGNKEYPPEDEAGFLEFARSLRSSVIHDAISGLKPLSPVRTYRATGNRLRRFDALERPPDGVVAFGDSVCAFNPVYGQGMTVAASSALALRASLEGPDAGLPRRFYRRLSRVIGPAWMLATSEDCRYPLSEGGRLMPVTRAMQRYVDRVAAASCQDLTVRRLWLELFHMRRGPGALFRPDIVARVLWARRREGGQPSIARLVASSTLIPRPRDQA
jgi:2-polyprenyl-6-methoxyphenol hydroxylase-like FAD-dependent oxidoreductase